MTINQYKSIMENTKAGVYQKATWRKVCKTKKSCQDTIEKEGSGTVRVKINYNNKKSVQLKRANGDLPEVNQGLPWGKYVEGCFPYLIEHNGVYYGRLYLDDCNPISTIWYLNGVAVPYSVVEPYLLASEKPKKTDKSIDCLTIKLENLIEIK